MAKAVETSSRNRSLLLALGLGNTAVPGASTRAGSARSTSSASSRGSSNPAHPWRTVAGEHRVHPDRHGAGGDRLRRQPGDGGGFGTQFVRRWRCSSPWTPPSRCVALDPTSPRLQWRVGPSRPCFGVLSAWGIEALRLFTAVYLVGKMRRIVICTARSAGGGDLGGCT